MYSVDIWLWIRNASSISYQELKTGHLQLSQNLQKVLNRYFDTRTQWDRTHTNLLKIVVNVADDKLRMGLSTILYRFGSDLDKYF